MDRNHFGCEVIAVCKVMMVKVVLTSAQVIKI